MIKKTIHIPLYDCKVIAVFCPDINAEKRRIYKRYGIDDDGSMDYGVVISPGDSVHLYYILLGTDYLTLNSFVHEITHLGHYILDQRGHQPLEVDEPLAYLNGYLAEELYKVMEKKGIEFIKPTKKTKRT